MSVTFTGIGMEPVPINFVGMYSDNTPMVKTDQWDTIVEFADTMILRADSLNEFMVGMFIVDAVNDSRFYDGTIKLVLPYLPGARQDRSNPTGDVLFTAKSIAREINSRRFSRVVSVDPHSPVMPGLIDNFVEYPLRRVYDRLWKGYAGVIAPDKGAKDRARQAWVEVGGSLRYGSKVRDVATGRLTGFDVEYLMPGKHYIVVDDICDGGGTFIGLGEKIREQGAKADLFVTHGIFSKGFDGLREIYDNIYTTNTRQLDLGDDHKRIIRFDVVSEMENYNEE